MERLETFTVKVNHVKEQLRFNLLAAVEVCLGISFTIYHPLTHEVISYSFPT